MGQGQVRTIPGNVAELLVHPELELKKLFGGGSDEDDKDKNKRKDDDDEGMDTDIESNVDDSMEKGKYGAKKSGGGKAKTDSTAIWHLVMLWSLPRIWYHHA